MTAHYINHYLPYTIDWVNFVIKQILYGPMFYEIKTHESFLVT